MFSGLHWTQHLLEATGCGTVVPQVTPLEMEGFITMSPYKSDLSFLES